MNVTESYCKIGSEFYPEDRMNINYGTNNYNEAFKEIVSFNKGYNGLCHDVICHALVLTRKVISVNGDGNKMVDIVS